MTPAKAFEVIVCGLLFGIPRQQRPSGTTVRWYLDRGREIPDFELPGRMIMMQRAEIRNYLTDLAAHDTWHGKETVKMLVDDHLDETRRLFERIANRR